MKTNYKVTIRDVVARLKKIGVDIEVGKDASGWSFGSVDGKRRFGSNYSGKEAVVFLTGYSRGREDEALAQMAGGGAELEEGGTRAD